MALTAEEARVLACLVEKERSVPDSYPMTLNALRLACNQTTARDPVVTYDDRTVDAALLSLKSMGLVRFVHPSHGGRTTRYRHTADERWRLTPAELGVLATLALRGPQTAGELRNRAARHLDGGDVTVDEALDALASRRPEPFAVRLERRSGEREVRFAHLLAGEVDESASGGPRSAASASAAVSGDSGSADDIASDAASDVTSDVSVEVTELAAELARLRARVDRLERELGVID